MGNICDTINIVNTDNINNMVNMTNMDDNKNKMTQRDKHKDFFPLRIVTLNTDIDESINKSDKINTMIEYFMKPCYGYYVDFMCIQGIRNVKILTEIVTAFKIRINKYNKKNSNSIILEYFPDVDVSKRDDNNIYWSTSESDDNITYYDKLIISRHNILQTADVSIPINNG